jgi:ubiquinone/menaquinone biosynthesis C-methylase UbiE
MTKINNSAGHRQTAFARATTRAIYVARQLPRLAWYVGHGRVMGRLAERASEIEGTSGRPPSRTDAPVPTRARLYEDMAALFQRDLMNVERGIYPIPSDRDGSLLTLIRRSGLFFEDLPRVHLRRKANAHNEVFNEHTRGKRPRYYLQNFHFQTDGWMSEESAERYDMQVEVLFNGTANAIRRQALPAMHEVLASRDQRRCSVLDVGCGTGRFLDFVKQAWPRLPCIGIDMSEAYLREARGHLTPRSWLKLLVAKGEAMPFPDASFDVVTNVFMFHELPPKVRRGVLKEFARVLKPGGRAILVDSLQYGDVPDYDGLLETFPQNFHEPYYRSYLGENFVQIATRSGLTHVRDERAFVSKVIVLDKPA